MTGERCRQIGKATKNLAGRIIAPSLAKRAENIRQISMVLNKLITKRTARSKFIYSDKVLLVLPPQETRRTSCPLTETQRSIIRDADAIIMKQANDEHEMRCKEAHRLRKELPKPTAMGYFSRPHKLRAER